LTIMFTPGSGVASSPEVTCPETVVCAYAVPRNISDAPRIINGRMDLEAKEMTFFSRNLFIVLFG